MTGGECGDVTIWTTNPWVKVKPSDAEALVGSWSATFDELLSSESVLGTFTMTFRSDGSMQLAEPSGDIGFYGDYSIFRGRLEISGGEDTVSVAYAIDGDELTFTDMIVPGCDDCEPYASRGSTNPGCASRGAAAAGPGLSVVPEVRAVPRCHDEGVRPTLLIVDDHAGFRRWRARCSRPRGSRSSGRPSTGPPP